MPRAIRSTPLALLLATTCACAPVSDTVGVNVAEGQGAVAKGTGLATLHDDGDRLSAVNPVGQSYAALGEQGMYTLQQSAFGAAAIGARGAFASDPKNTSFGLLEMELIPAETPLVIDGQVVGAQTTALPSRITVRDFNADLATVIAAQVGLAERELERLKAMEATERDVFLQEVKSRGDLYTSIIEALARAAGL